VQRVAVIQPSIDESLDQDSDCVLRQASNKRMQLPEPVQHKAENVSLKPVPTLTAGCVLSSHWTLALIK